MRVLIIEDEFHAAEHLKRLVCKYLPEAELVGTIDTVEEAVEWFSSHSHPDLTFMDIQLADGISFSIFDQVQIDSPVIFTTAYNEYSIRAFKVNSIDYLLKPIDDTELSSAIRKFRNMENQQVKPMMESMTVLFEQFGKKPVYKERFLLKNRDKYSFLLANEIAYFYSEDSLTFIITAKGNSFMYDEPLSKLNEQLDPGKFFQINRKWIVGISSIRHIHAHFNGRVKLELQPHPSKEVFVSRDNVKEFKKWLGG
jgi:DNA-binding LytR/AlgR family response regulator